MSEEEQKICDEAVAWVKVHQRELVEKFAGEYEPALGNPVSIFMAGSPGADKTEFSKHLLENFTRDSSLSIVRIDPDEIRQWLPQYMPGKAHLFQTAVSVAVEKLHDHVLDAKKHFLLDGTFANLAKAGDNIRRSLRKGRAVVIEYVYQEPLIAWDFTQKREAIEGRNIPKESFIEQLFAARENIVRVQEEFGESVTIKMIRRNIQTGLYDICSLTTDIAEHAVIGYTQDELRKLL